MFRICNAIRRTLTQKIMRKDASFRYGTLNVGLIKINSFIFGVSRLRNWISIFLNVTLCCPVDRWQPFGRYKIHTSILKGEATNFLYSFCLCRKLHCVARKKFLILQITHCFFLRFNELTSLHCDIWRFKDYNISYRLIRCVWINWKIKAQIVDCFTFRHFLL